MRCSRDSSLRERVLHYAMPEPNTGCWLWGAYVSENGYGKIGFEGKTLYAHRVAYELLRGPISDDFELDHLCKVRSCVNPDHLEPVSRLENVRRSSVANKTSCKNGHPFSEENTWVEKNGSRHCRECARLRSYRQFKLKGRWSRKVH